MAKSLLKTAAGKVDVAVLILRIGIAVPFIYAGLGKFGMTQKMVQGMFMMVGFPAGTAAALTTLFGALEVLAGLFILLGLLTRFSALWMVIVLVLAASFFKLDFTQGPAIWKDPGLLGASLALLIYGGGKYSVDASLIK